jgi:hypothetical protein
MESFTSVDGVIRGSQTPACLAAAGTAAETTLSHVIWWCPVTQMSPCYVSTFEVRASDRFAVPYNYPTLNATHAYPALCFRPPPCAVRFQPDGTNVRTVLVGVDKQPAVCRHD